MLAAEVDDGGGLVLDRTGDRKFAIGRDVYVVHTAIDGNALPPCQRNSVNHINNAWIRPYTDENPASIFRDGDIVRTGTDCHLLQNLAALAIQHVEHALGFVADIDPRAIRRERNAVRQLDAPYYLHDLILCRVDHINRVSRTVGDIDARDRL